MANPTFVDKKKDQYGVIIGVGSNINAEENIKKMLHLIHSVVNVLKISSWLKTAPIGITDQKEYTNGAILALTELNQDELNVKLKHIEDQCGRDRSLPKFGPRTMDLDILIWEGMIIDEDVYSRDFLQTSIKELVPNFIIH